jgi:hypothetical protein
VSISLSYQIRDGLVGCQSLVSLLFELGFHRFILRLKVERRRKKGEK